MVLSSQGSKLFHIESLPALQFVKLRHTFVTIVTIRSLLALAQLTQWIYNTGSLLAVL